MKSLTSMMSFRLVAAGALVVLGAGSQAAAADGTPFNIGEKFVLVAPANWEAKEPRSRIVEYEFETPKAEGDEFAGRERLHEAAAQQQLVPRRLGLGRILAQRLAEQHRATHEPTPA